jgi:hypothetical protein
VSAVRLAALGVFPSLFLGVNIAFEKRLKDEQHAFDGPLDIPIGKQHRKAHWVGWEQPLGGQIIRYGRSKMEKFLRWILYFMIKNDYKY